jgi:secreted PhoX family phosphatase
MSFLNTVKRRFLALALASMTLVGSAVSPIAANASGTAPSAMPSGVPPLKAGTVVVSQGGTIFGTGGSGIGTTVAQNGEVDLYAPNADGDAAPKARFTQSMYGPTTLAFDPKGDLWVANENISSLANTSILVEFTKAQLATANPVPSVTITTAVTGALANPFGMAFDRQSNLWLVGNSLGVVYEYTKDQLATSGAPTPQTTIPSSSFPGTPLSDAFDGQGDLWVSTNLSTSCPQGCVVEFSETELAQANPTPTVTITSTGGANLAFTPAGNLWLVTGGGPTCFGTPCTNQLVEFTRDQLATSGAPPPAVTISSTTVGSTQSLDGPYGVALAPSGEVWVANFNNNSTVEYGRDQLAQSGSPIPQRIIAGPNSGMNFPSFVVVKPGG